MSRTDRGGGSPRAIIHKQILDAAASRPDAPLEAIADDVAGATTDLVERVLDEYGDPADTSIEPEATETQEPAMKENGEQATTEPATATAESAAEPDLAALSEKQRETLRLVHEHPEWAQSDMAETLDVSRATVSRRLNDIPGFEWQDREAFTRRVFDDEPGSVGDSETGTPDQEADTDTPEEKRLSDDGNEDEVGDEPDADASQSPDRNDTADSGGETDGSGSDGESDAVAVIGGREAFDQFDERLDRIEAQIEGVDRTQSVSLPPELAHKVVHACMKSDRISETEELQLLEALM